MKARALLSTWAPACVIAFAVSLAPCGAAPRDSTAPPASAAPPNDHAQAQATGAPVNAGAPDLALTMALAAAGGGPVAFDPQKVVDALMRTRTPTPGRPISGPSSSPEVMAAFNLTFRYFMTDALAQLAKAGGGFPSPLPQGDDPVALSAALYTAGVTSDGVFDVRYMLDTLVSHPIHARVMADIDANPDLGSKADADFHVALGELVAGPARTPAKRK